MTGVLGALLKLPVEVKDFIHAMHQQASGVETSCSLGRISEDPAEAMGLCPANAECPMLTETVFLFLGQVAEG